MPYYIQPYMPIQTSQLPAGTANTQQLQQAQIYQNIAASVPTNSNNNNNNTNTNNTPNNTNALIYKTSDPSQVYVNKVPTNIQINAQQAYQANNPTAAQPLQYYQNNKTSNQQYNNNTLNKLPTSTLPTQIHPHHAHHHAITSMQQYSLISPANGVATNNIYQIQAQPIFQPIHTLQPQQNNNNNKYPSQPAISKTTTHLVQQQFNQNTKPITTTAQHNNNNQMQYSNSAANINKSNNTRPSQSVNANIPNKNQTSSQQYLYQQQNNSYYQNQNPYYQQQQQIQMQQQQQQSYYQYNRNKNQMNFNNNKNKLVNNYQRPFNKNRYNNKTNDTFSKLEKPSQQQNESLILEAYDFSSGLTLSIFENHIKKINDKIHFSYIRCNDLVTISFNDLNNNILKDKDLTYLNNSFYILLNFNNHEEFSQIYELFNLNEQFRQQFKELDAIISENSLRNLFKLRYFEVDVAAGVDQPVANEDDTNIDEEEEETGTTTTVD
jgi:hypothetical protein